MDENGVACWGSPAAQRHTHFLAEALRLSVASMRKEPERHAEAIAVAERELEAIRALRAPVVRRERRIAVPSGRALRALGMTLLAFGLFVLPGNLVTREVLPERLCTEFGLAAMLIGAPLAMQRRRSMSEGEW
jgi:ferric-dicitrate binding protein FerR (iron transport regulator)